VAARPQPIALAASPLHPQQGPDSRPPGGLRPLSTSSAAARGQSPPVRRELHPPPRRAARMAGEGDDPPVCDGRRAPRPCPASTRSAAPMLPPAHFLPCTGRPASDATRLPHCAKSKSVGASREHRGGPAPGAWHPGRDIRDRGATITLSYRSAWSAGGGRLPAGDDHGAQGASERPARRSPSASRQETGQLPVAYVNVTATGRFDTPPVRRPHACDGTRPAWRVSATLFEDSGALKSR
jgi:hypothetical protein